MKKTSKNFDLSDNLYYADQIGSVEEQIEWLDSLHISEPFLYKDAKTRAETFEFIARPFKDDPLRAKIFVLKPHLSGHPVVFTGIKSLDIRRYLLDRFEPSHILITFKPKSLCEEDHSDGEEATVPVAD